MSFKFIAASLFSVLAVSAAHASTIIVNNGAVSASVTATNAAGIAAPFNLANLGNANSNGFVSNATTPFSGGVISFTGTTSPLSGIYDGSTTNVASNPYANTRLASANYLVAEPVGSVVIAYTTPQSVVNLLWGSPDTYNSLNLEFLNGTSVVGNISLTGSQIADAAGVSVGGSNSAYVSITPGGSLSAFNTVVATSGTAAFEFNIGTGTTAVPEPTTMALLAAGLVGLSLRRSRRA